MLRQFPHNIELQNTDSGVLQKSSKHFLITIFFPPFSFRTPPPPPPSKKKFHFLLSGEGEHPLPVPPPLGTSCLKQGLRKQMFHLPARYFVSRTMSTYVLLFCSSKCVLSICIYNIALGERPFDFQGGGGFEKNILALIFVKKNILASTPKKKKKV